MSNEDERSPPLSSRHLVRGASEHSDGLGGLGAGRAGDQQQRADLGQITEENNFSEVKLPNLSNGKNNIPGSSDIFSEKKQREGDDKKDEASDLS